MWNYFEDTHKRIRKNLINVIEENGYPWEEYEVTTEDGYINSMWRIPYSNKNKGNNNERRQPVLLFHGMTCSSAVFLNECRLAYFLADEGYDVWLPNNRGSSFSNKHVTLDANKDKDKYWDFSWHEIGVYDIPAFVDFVTKHTGFQKVYYVGHSQGTTAYAVFASERPEYNEKISLSCLLGTAIAANFTYSYSLLFLLYVVAPLIEFVDKYIIRIHEIPFLGLIRFLEEYTSASTLGRYVNLVILFWVAGHPNFEQASEFDFIKFSRTTPNVSSVRQMYHYRQIMTKGRFAKYDFGPEKNIEKYGSIEPPEYNLSKATSPIALFYGKNDMFNDYRKDKLDEKFANVVHIHVADDENFNHVDFLIAKDSVPLLYNHMVKIMREYKPV